MPADGLLGGPTIELLGGRVPTRDFTVQVLTDHGIDEAIDDGRLLSRRGLGLLARLPARRFAERPFDDEAQAGHAPAVQNIIRPGSHQFHRLVFIGRRRDDDQGQIASGVPHQLQRCQGAESRQRDVGQHNFPQQLVERRMHGLGRLDLLPGRNKP